MLNQKMVQTIVGLFMLMGILALMFLALRVSGLANGWDTGGYEVTGNFQNIGGLKIRAPVTMSGVTIGKVKRIQLDTGSFDATVTLDIQNKYNQLPTDTSASIYTEGLLGSNYISLSPGYATQYLHDGSKIAVTHSALILENLIGQLVYKIGGTS